MRAEGYDLAEIRRRADVVEIMSPHVVLRKSGRRLAGLCPFHEEKTPSFTVDPETGLWHCFGCKAGGDLFRFVEMIEKVTFGEAVEMLARRLGVPPSRPAQAARQRERERLLELHRVACSFFQAQLQGSAGRQAAVYVEQRGLSAESIQGFAIGYAPAGWEALVAAMGRRGYPAQELVRAGLAVPREGGYYDRFRDRVIFPIRDVTGRVIAFGGRALGEDQQPKYLNSPETPLFQKGRTLYAFDRARRAMGEVGHALVVEGYLDAIACHEAGFTSAVATMGTALTPEHVEMLRRRVSRLVLAFDADSAGLMAALRGRDLFTRAGLAVRVAALPEDMDPDQVIRERGGEAFGELVGRAAPMIEWELGRILARLEGVGDAGRVEVMHEAVAALARLPAGVEREHYTRWLVEKLNADSPARAAQMEAAVREEMARMSARRESGGRRTEGGAARTGAVAEHLPGAPGGSRIEAELLAALVRHGELATYYAPRLEADDFSGEHRSVFEAIRSLVATGEPVTPQTVLGELGAEGRGSLAELVASDIPEERVEERVATAASRLLENRLRRQGADLRRQLEGPRSEQERQEILQQLTECWRERLRLAGRRTVGEG